MSMCLDVISFTKDNVNARKDLATLCDRPSLEAKPNARGKLRRPKAPYCLKPIERNEVDIEVFRPLCGKHKTTSQCRQW
jgi:hypothetical protein